VHLRVRSRACGACRSLRAFSGNPALNSHRAGNQSPFCRHYVRRLRYVIAYEYVITGRGHHLGCLFSPRRQHVCLIKAAVAPSTLHSLSRRRAPRFTPLSPSLSLSLSTCGSKGQHPLHPPPARRIVRRVRMRRVAFAKHLQSANHAAANVTEKHVFCFTMTSRESLTCRSRNFPARLLGGPFSGERGTIFGSL